MLETIVVVLLLLWILGLVSGATIGGLIHILAVVALGAIVANKRHRRNPDTTQ